MAASSRKSTTSVDKQKEMSHLPTVSEAGKEQPELLSELAILLLINGTRKFQFSVISVRNWGIMLEIVTSMVVR